MTQAERISADFAMLEAKSDMHGVVAVDDLIELCNAHYKYTQEDVQRWIAWQQVQKLMVSEVVGVTVYIMRTCNIN